MSYDSVQLEILMEAMEKNIDTNISCKVALTLQQIKTRTKVDEANAAVHFSRGVTQASKLSRTL